MEYRQTRTQTNTKDKNKNSDKDRETDSLADKNIGAKCGIQTHRNRHTHRVLSKDNYNDGDEYKYKYKDRAAEIWAQNEVQKDTRTHILHSHHFPIFHSRGTMG